MAASTTSELRITRSELNPERDDWVMGSFGSRNELSCERACAWLASFDPAQEDRMIEAFLPVLFDRESPESSIRNLSGFLALTNTTYCNVLDAAKLIAIHVPTLSAKGAQLINLMERFERQVEDRILELKRA